MMVDAEIKRHFLRTCISLGCLNSVQLNKVLKNYDADFSSNRQSLDHLVSSINSELQEFDQSLSFVKHSLVNEEFLVFYHTFHYDVLKESTCYNKAEKHWFGKLLVEIYKGENHGLLWNDVYQVCSHSSAIIKKNRMQELINIWIRQGYFLDHDEKYFLGPRTLVEYDAYLNEKISDFKKCPLCKKSVYWDVKCNDCQIHIHLDCMKKYLRTMTNCPNCKNKWNTRLSL